jgi:hypothetical protein
VNAAMRASREKRSAEHDDGGLGTGVFAAFPTRWLPGEVTGVDQSAEDWQERVLSAGSRHSGLQALGHGGGAGLGDRRRAAPRRAEVRRR